MCERFLDDALFLIAKLFINGVFLTWTTIPRYLSILLNCQSLVKLRLLLAHRTRTWRLNKRLECPYIITVGCKFPFLL